MGRAPHRSRMLKVNSTFKRNPLTITWEKLQIGCMVLHQFKQYLRQTPKSKAEGSDFHRFYACYELLMRNQSHEK